MPDKYAIAKVAFPNPSEGHVSKNSIKNSMPHDRPYYTFDIHESHCQVSYLPLYIKVNTRKLFSQRERIFL